MAAQCPKQKAQTPSVWSRVACVSKVSFADLSTAAQLSSEVCWETVTQAQEVPPVTLLLGDQSGNWTSLLWGNLLIQEKGFTDTRPIEISAGGRLTSYLY